MGKNRFFDIEALKEFGVTQSMLAEDMGVKRQEINDWLTGKKRIAPLSMKRVCVSLTKLTGQRFFPADVFKIIDAEIKRRDKK